MREVVVNRKTMCNAIEDVLLKGKYKGASKSKVGMINENVACIVKSQQMILANASHTIAAQVSINCETGIESIKESEWLFFDAEKVIKYLKSMKDETVTLKIGDASLSIVGTSSVKMPLSVEHSGLKGIAKLLTAKIMEGKGHFGSTVFETVMVISDGTKIAQAIKECSVVGTSAYKLVFDGDTLTCSSSNFQQTETYTSNIELTDGGNGDPVTIEFSAPLDKFCKGPIWICLKEASPILLIGGDRKLIVAPYIRGN